MTQIIPDKRPNCEEILEGKHFWSLDEDESEIEIPIIDILKSQNEDELTFFHSMLESKLIEIIDFGIENTKNCSTRREFTTKLLLSLIHRPPIVMSCLSHLYDDTLTFCESSSDLIELLVIVMRNHTNIADIQLNAIKCMHNLTKDELGEKISSIILEEVVGVTLKAMEFFPNHRQLNVNSLHIFRNQYILEKISFKKYECFQLLLNLFVNFKDRFMNELAIKMCILIFDQLSGAEKSNLCSNPVHMQSLLDIIRSLVQNALDQNILESYLVFLWFLTDDSPKTCNLFLEKRGLELHFLVLNVSQGKFYCFNHYYLYLKKFSNKSLFKEFIGNHNIEMRVLALFYNIAEFPFFRQHLVTKEFLPVLRYF